MESCPSSCHQHPDSEKKGQKEKLQARVIFPLAPLCPGDLRGTAPGKQEQSLAWGFHLPLLSVQTCSSCASSGITRKVLQPWRFLDLRMSPKIWSPMYKISFPLAPSRSQTVSEEPERRIAWLRKGSQKETCASFWRARFRNRACVLSSHKPPLLNVAALLGCGSTGHCPPTTKFSQEQLCPRTAPHEWQQQRDHTASHPSNGGFIAGSPVYPPTALSWLRGPSKLGHTGGSIISTAGNIALGQLQLPLHHKLCTGVSQTLPGKEEQGIWGGMCPFFPDTGQQ